MVGQKAGAACPPIDLAAPRMQDGPATWSCAALEADPTPACKLDRVALAPNILKSFSHWYAVCCDDDSGPWQRPQVNSLHALVWTRGRYVVGSLLDPDAFLFIV